MTTLIPFADDAASLLIGKLTIENGTDRLAIYGSLDITRDHRGLAQARALQVILDQAVRTLEDQKDLPQVLAPVAVKTVKNPFG